MLIAYSVIATATFVFWSMAIGPMWTGAIVALAWPVYLPILGGAWVYEELGFGWWFLVLATGAVLLAVLLGQWLSDATPQHI